MTTGLYRRVALAVHDAKTLTGAQIRDLFYDVTLATLTNAVCNAIHDGYISGSLSYSQRRKIHMRPDAVFIARRAPKPAIPQKAVLAVQPKRTGGGRPLGGAAAVAIARGETPPPIRPKRDYPEVRASRDDRPVPDRSHLWPELMGNAEFEDDPRSLAERHVLWRRPVPPHRLFSVTGCAAAMLVASR